MELVNLLSTLTEAEMERVLQLAVEQGGEVDIANRLQSLFCQWRTANGAAIEKVVVA